MLRQALQGYRQAVRRPASGCCSWRGGHRALPGLLPAFLHAGSAGYGALVAAVGAGALLGVVAGPALSGRLPPSLRIGVVIVAGAPLFGLLRFAPDLTVAAGARMTITSLGFPLGSAVGGAVMGGIGVPAVILAIACSYLALGLLPLLAPPLRATVEFTRATG